MQDIRYKVLWIGEIAKHKGIGETKVLQEKKKAKVLQILIPDIDTVEIQKSTGYETNGLDVLETRFDWLYSAALSLDM